MENETAQTQIGLWGMILILYGMIAFILLLNTDWRDAENKKQALKWLIHVTFWPLAVIYLIFYAIIDYWRDLPDE